VTTLGAIFAPLRHMKPEAHWAAPVDELRVMLKPVFVFVSKNAQMPPQTWAPDKVVVGSRDTLYKVAVGAAETVVLVVTVWDGKML